MRIAICDDDKPIVDNLHEKVQKVMDNLEVNVKIFDFTDGGDLIYEIESTGIFDVIFLDIEIGKSNGIDIASKLNSASYEFTLIFISQYDFYYMAAFEVQPFWFLSKPFSDEKIEQALSKAVKNIRYKYETFNYFFNKQYYRLLIDKILYFESDRRVVNIYCVDTEVGKCYNKLDEIEKEFEDKHREFVRVNQSTYINKMYIKIWTFENVELVNGKIFSISKKYREIVRHEYLEIILQRMNIR